MRRGVAVLCLLLGAGCAHQSPHVQTAPAPARKAAADPTPALITAADALLQQGLTESRAGHMIAAREAFDQAVDTYLTAPGGAYANPRRTQAYRRTLETIHVHEMEALVAGDGFTEPTPDPASIDELADLRPDETPAPEDTRRAAEEVAKEGPSDLPVVLNDEVLGCITLYQTTLRDWFAEALARGGRYLPRIREVFAQEGIPQDLAYLAMVESAFRPSALSRANARGVWQFIPETGRRFGLKQDWWVDERSDPEKATKAAAAYLHQLYDIFGDWNLAMAGYNAGEGRIVRAMSRYNTDDFWELNTRGALPRETSNYVPMIQAAILVARAPDKYGFEITPEPEEKADTVLVKGAVDLRVAAECAHTDVEALRQLNPALRRLATPAGSFELKVPEGASTSFHSCLAAIPAERRVTFRTHVVARGQTLSSIGRTYGVTVGAIAQANNLRSTSRLARGTELIIPIEPRGTRSAAAVAPPRPQTAALGRGPLASNGPAELPPGSASKATPILYKVQSGDTLSSIAVRFRTTVAQLTSWNRLRGTRLVAGNTLTIYTTRN